MAKYYNQALNYINNIFPYNNYKYDIYIHGDHFIECKINIYGLDINKIKNTIEKSTYEIHQKYMEKIYNNNNDDDLVVLNLLSVFTFKAKEFSYRDEESNLYTMKIIGSNLSEDDLKHFTRETIRNIVEKIDRYNTTEIFFIKIKLV